MTAAAYPLAWPPGWKRTESYQRKPALFVDRSKQAIGIAEGVKRVFVELERLGVKDQDIVISTNVRPTLGGRASEGTGKIPDPGVAVYWTTKAGDSRCIAIDRYNGVAGNLGAIAATLEAMRAIERHGGAAILERAFTGFTALEAPKGVMPWDILGIPAAADRRRVEEAYRKLAAEHHPDRGGDGHRMAEINKARDFMIGRLGG